MSDALPPRSSHRPSNAQWVLAGFVVVMGAFSLALRATYTTHLEQTSLLFVGLPTFLGAALALAPRAGTAIGMALRGVTLALLLSAIAFGEGFVCIAMAAPLFYGFAILAAVLVDVIRAGRGGPRSFAVALVPALVIASAEGSWPSLSFDRAETVAVTKVVAASPEAVEAALARTPTFPDPLPPFLRLGFPVPVEASGAGLEPGDQRTIHFAGGEGHPGDMTFAVADRGPGHVRFALVDDTSHIAHWLDWDRSEVTWAPDPAGGTRVTWTVGFTRRLDPAWYFAPAERHAVALAAEVLVDQVATP